MAVTMMLTLCPFRGVRYGISGATPRRSESQRQSIVKRWGIVSPLRSVMRSSRTMSPRPNGYSVIRREGLIHVSGCQVAPAVNSPTRAHQAAQAG